MLVYLVTIIALDCKVPKALTFFFVANVVIFLYLFSDFYRKAYKKNRAGAQAVATTDKMIQALADQPTISKAYPVSNGHVKST